MPLLFLATLVVVVAVGVLLVVVES